METVFHTQAYNIPGKEILVISHAPDHLSKKNTYQSNEISFPRTPSLYNEAAAEPLSERGEARARLAGG